MPEWGSRWEFATLSSTNDKARELIQAGQVEEGDTIFTPHQTAGRGQRETSWESQPGQNLTFSLVLFPKDLKAEYQFYLNQVVTLGIIDVLKTYQHDKSWRIKWPNDIYYENRKLGGILIENGLEGPYMQFAVVGIGINVNQQQFPDHLNSATSLYRISQARIDLKTLLRQLVQSIKGWYQQLETNQWQVIQTAYEQWLYRKGQWHDFRIENGKVLRARILGVEANGLLVVETPGGKRMQFNFKEIGF